MIAAELRGKLRSLEHQEDVLTSNVFTTLRLFPPSALLRPFLATGAPDLARRITAAHRARYVFWTPLRPDRTEPDVLIELEAYGEPTILLLVEVKYLSGLSGGRESDENDGPGTGQPDASRHQLLREASALAGHRPGAEALRAVVYVTTHACVPDRDLPPPESARAPIHWLAWRDLVGVIERVLPGLGEDDLARPQLEELRDLLRRKGLDRFRGYLQFDGRAPRVAPRSRRAFRSDGAFAGFRSLASLAPILQRRAGPVFFRARGV